MRCGLKPLLTLALLFCAWPDSGPAITLDDVMAARFPSGLAWSPDSQHVAFVWDVGGRRNIYYESAYGSGTPTPLTKFTDDGPEISEPQWSPDGTQIAFEREGIIYVSILITAQSGSVGRTVTVRAPGETKQLAAGGEKSPASDPRWSPDGKRIAYVSEGVLYTITPPSGTAERVYRDRIAKDSSPRWSPDGQWLAFVSTRGKHSIVGLYSFANKDVRWLEPSTDWDGAPIWSPDSKQVAFTRIFSNGETAQVRVAPATFTSDYTIPSRVVWQETNHRGAGYYLEARFATPARLVVQSEDDGFAHLYRVDLESGKRSELTRGSYEDEFFDVAKNGSIVVAASNHHDLHERGLWEVEVVTGKSRELTGHLQPHPVEASTVDVRPAISPDGTMAAYLHSSPCETLGVWVLDVATGKVRALAEEMPPGLKNAKLAMPQVINYSGFDGQQLYGILYKPAEIPPGKKIPAIVFIHGGPVRQMLKGWHYMQYYHDIHSFHQWLVEKGYAVLCVNFRGGIGYGRAFRQATSLNMGRVDYEDSIYGARWLSEQTWVAADHVAMWGGSYGGYMTGLALGRDPQLFRCGVALHGVYDWRPFATTFQADEDVYWEKLFGGQPSQNQERYYVADAVEFVKNIQAPLLLFHGDNDHNVPYDQSREFIRELRKYHKDFQFVGFPDEPHDFLRSATWREIFRMTAEFFDQQLK
jgi:dipeptidyl aminopeptidase/acylaminoacyl peptidase